VRVEIPDVAAPRTLAPRQHPLAVIFEDDALLVIDKPAGLVVHPAPGHWSGTLVNAILWHLQRHNTNESAEFGVRSAEWKTKIPNSELQTPNLTRAGIVHRLDKDTSGLLLVAKTESAHHFLSRQLKARRIHRRYVAIVEGHLPLDAGTINAAIGRHAIHRKEMTVRHLGGRSAVTHYRVLKRAAKELPPVVSDQQPPPEADPPPAGATSNTRFQEGLQVAGRRSQASAVPIRLDYTVVDISLETGRTHQIRVHFGHLGHSVVGDSTYGKHPAGFWQPLGVRRQLLHAYCLSFQHPSTGQSLDVSCPIPEDMQQWIAREER